MICLLLFSIAFFLGATISGFVLRPVVQRSQPSSVRVVCKPPALLGAKPPPTANFDLDAIEAFESQLDLEDFLDDNDDDDDGGDDIFEEDEGSSAVDVKVFVVPAALNKKRIDAVIAELNPELSRSFCGTLVANGSVYIVNGEKKEMIDRKSFKVQTGLHLEIQIPLEEQLTEIIAQELPLDILFEDEHMIVLNKAANMVVHPAAGNWDGTVVNALAYYLQDSPYGSGDFVDGELSATEDSVIDAVGTDGESISFRPGIVHRLDKGTTGVLVVAKTTQALAALSEAFASRKVKKTYLAVTVGNPGKRVTIDKPIGRHPIHRQRMRVVPDPHRRDSSGLAPKDRMFDERPASQVGRRALSFVDTIAFDGKLSLVQVQIATGRTHQIRVHLQDRHTPIYGDDIYGLKDWNKRLAKMHQIERPLLHAYMLELEHPITGDMLSFRAPLADDMLQVTSAIYPQGESERPDIFAVSD